MIRIIDIPATLDVGCTQCGVRAIRCIVHDNGRCLEVIETQCLQHSIPEAA